MLNGGQILTLLAGGLEGDAVAPGAGTQPGDHAGLHRELVLVVDRLGLQGGAGGPLDGGGERRPVLRVDTNLVTAQYLREEGGEGGVADL